MQIGMWKTIVGVQIGSKFVKIDSICPYYLGVFWTFDCGMLSTQQNSVSTVAKIAIVATLSRQGVDNSSIAYT